MASGLIDLIFDGIGRHHLDITVNDLGRLVADWNAMPGMSLKT